MPAMPITEMLIVKLMPMVAFMAMGFVAGRWLSADRQTIASMMLYLIVPFVFYTGIAQMEMQLRLLAVPLLSFGLASAVGLVAYAVAQHLYGDSRANIIGMASGTGNNGYFGLPIAMLLFDEQTVGVYLLCIVGISLFESSIGFFMTARGEHEPAEALRRTLRMPMLYAFLLGSVAAFMEWRPAGFMLDMLEYCKGAYTVLGMMMIGIGLASMTRFRVDMGFTALLFFNKFIFWPALAVGVVWVDRIFLGVYSPSVHQALLLISVMPLAANSVAIAALLNCQPQRTAAAVLLSTIFGIFFVPWVAGFILP
jgi:predicted permease